MFFGCMLLSIHARFFAREHGFEIDTCLEYPAARQRTRCMIWHGAMWQIAARRDPIVALGGPVGMLVKIYESMLVKI